MATREANHRQRGGLTDLAGAVTLQPNVSLALIQSSATSVRLHASVPASYALAVSTAVGLKSFVAGSLFSFQGSDTIVTPQFSGATIGGGGTAAFFSVAADGTSALLATGPLPTPTVLNQDNWLLSLSLSDRFGSPVLTVV